MNSTAMVVALGACAGLALSLLIAAVAPAPRLDLVAAMTQVQNRHSPADAAGMPRGRRRWRPVQVLAGLAERAAGSNSRWWGAPVVELELLQRTVIGYVAARLAWGLFVCATIILIGSALGADVLAVLVLAVVGAVAGSLIPATRVRRAAAATRLEFARTLASYLELVAQERAAGAAPTTALTEAATLGNGLVFSRIREILTLTRTRHTGTPAWDALSEWGQRFQVPAMVELADITATAADGAAIYTTLTAKAAALRQAALATDREEANRRSETLVGPLACLLIAFMILISYPLFARLLERM
ncbi:MULTISPECIES: pilus assembly protein TadB [unclassified Crossiella]|uniref:pilus assembly protein TadB n=1 Tax=unclassified Crossiella TaxID=2620835 RepID=UPI001FFFEF57|nr:MULTISPECIES: pilus assembly protein TadB [unclassified Crossiella]MCK2243693.1 pilus assembly protein TadB [Crossiella sp. S99.2]MCK2257552.1 pilus assembly protein TadB [Crossiella sp. S99.1]